MGSMLQIKKSVWQPISCRVMLLTVAFLFLGCVAKNDNAPLAPESNPSAIAVDEGSNPAIVQEVQAFERCTTADECMLTPGPCGEPAGINKNRQDEYSGYLARISVMCPDTTHKVEASGVECISNRCSAILESSPAPEQPDFHACQQDSECVIATGICSTAAAVNKKHLDAFKQEVATQSQVVDCVAPDPNPPKYNARCIASRCDAVPEK
jgi:hypothetical protein